jgi:hypothetical protein
MTRIKIIAVTCSFLIAGLINSVGGAASDPGDLASPPDSLVTYTEDREICANRSATGNAYFGDLHIHTGFSYDARPLGTQTTPADAYRFARGGSIPVPPYDEQGEPMETLRLQRPLDFAAVTDHSEFFGELTLCTDPSSSVYDQKTCQLLRDGGGAGMFPFVKVVLMTHPQRIPEICGETGAPCNEASISLWEITQDMAEDAYDRSSSCQFTSFVGYEHTGTPNANNYHRNVIFRNNNVPERAISYIEAPKDHDLWAQLSEKCLDGKPGCDVLVIPHNSNLSAGSMFPSYIARFESKESAKQQAELRNAMEPVMEIFQHKGNSECFNGLPDILGEPDELCDMEQARAVGNRTDSAGKQHTVRFCEDGEIGTRGFSLIGCVSKNDFFRSVLLTGLQDAAVIGVNSYKMGAIASTDTHISLAGGTDEREWHGHLVDESTLPLRLRNRPTSPRSLSANPGGLAGIWAVENSRDALFEALRRREVFGTTGTRIQPRLFGGWDIAMDACERHDQAEYGYAMGTPMGGDLGTRPTGAKPRLLATAVQDPDSAQLQKLQIIKGWVDAEGKSNYQVLEVAGQQSAEGTVDLDSGRWSGRGSPVLCSVFEDAQFDPAEPAYYYLRAVEVPSLRWSWSQCVALPVSERPAECDNDAPKTIQEMAWTSPIWYLASEESSD